MKNVIVTALVSLALVSVAAPAFAHVGMHKPTALELAVPAYPNAGGSELPLVFVGTVAPVVDRHSGAAGQHGSK